MTNYISVGKFDISKHMVIVLNGMLLSKHTAMHVISEDFQKRFEESFNYLTSNKKLQLHSSLFKHTRIIRDTSNNKYNYIDFETRHPELDSNCNTITFTNNEGYKELEKNHYNFDYSSAIFIERN